MYQEPQPAQASQSQQIASSKEYTYPEEACGDGEAHARLSVGKGIDFGTVRERYRSLTRRIEGYDDISHGPDRERLSMRIDGLTAKEKDEQTNQACSRVVGVFDSSGHQSTKAGSKQSPELFLSIESTTAIEDRDLPFEET